jgi:predicted membrane protein
MIGLAQFGIAIGALGVVLTFMSLFPGAIGMNNPTAGIGIVQFAGIMSGFMLLIMGALLYVKFTFYEGRVAGLAQQIGIRLALTGLVLAGMVGLADIFGFGSHPRSLESDAFFGPLQAIGTLVGFAMSSLGVVVYALTGTPPDEPPKP